MRVLMATGGTGGHIFPAISVAEEIKRRRPETQFLFIGSRNKAVKELPFVRGAHVANIPALGMPRKVSVHLAPFAFQMLVGLDHSLRRVASFRPHVALGFGNFSSFAPLLAAKVRGVPVVIHEANAIPGRANLLLSRVSHRVLVNFPVAGRHFPNGNVQVVGMPLRKEFAQPRNRLGALAELKLSGTRFTLLVIGGSQGAHALNSQVCSLLPILERMSDKIQLIHLTGRSDYPWVRACHERSSLRSCVIVFEHRMKMLYDAADLVVARAGASTIAEIIHTGKPAVLVPFPHAASRHQEENAGYLRANNGAVVLTERPSSSGREPLVPGLLETITQLVGDPRRLQEMADATRRLANGPAAPRIVDVLFEIARPETAVATLSRRRPLSPEP